VVVAVALQHAIATLLSSFSPFQYNNNADAAIIALPQVAVILQKSSKYCHQEGKKISIISSFSFAW
jgi:cellobiose-specific phosphotransferase system component IIB